MEEKQISEFLSREGHLLLLNENVHHCFFTKIAELVHFLRRKSVSFLRNRALLFPIRMEELCDTGASHVLLSRKELFNFLLRDRGALCYSV